MSFDSLVILGDTVYEAFEKDRLRKRLKIERVVLKAIVDCTRN